MTQQQEQHHREQMWHRLIEAGGPMGVSPGLLRELGIYGGAQGIWVDKARTRELSPQDTGITVGLLHTGTSYADDLAEDGVLYHYPKTGRPPEMTAGNLCTRHYGPPGQRSGKSPSIGTWNGALNPPSSLGRGRVVHKGRSMAFLSGELTTAGGKLVATATATARIVATE